MFKHHLVIEIEGDDKGFAGRLVEGPTQLEGVSVGEKMAVIYSMIHIVASHVYELRDPEDPTFDLNNSIATAFEKMQESIHEFLGKVGVVECACVDGGEVSHLKFKIDDNPGGMYN